jgi:hypothetical protein
MLVWVTARRRQNYWMVLVTVREGKREKEREGFHT